jgi:uncharacterized membrane protein YphA (DoxX/SURF4 family)
VRGAGPSERPLAPGQRGRRGLVPARPARDARADRRRRWRKEGILSTDILSWVAPITGISAAIMVALNAGTRFTGWGFVVFTVSSLAWVALGAAQGLQSLVIQNGVLFVVNLVGIYRWLFVKYRYEKGAAVAGRSASRLRGWLSSRRAAGTLHQTGR